MAFEHRIAEERPIQFLDDESDRRQAVDRIHPNMIILADVFPPEAGIDD